MKVKMLATAADESRILRAGLVYNLPAEEAAILCKGSAVPGIGAYAVPAPDAKKVERIPPQPDPEDIPVDDLSGLDDE